MRRRLRYGFAAVMIVAVAFPIAGPTDGDGFPLSTYPMFSRPLAHVTSQSTAIAFDRNGDRVALTPAMIGGTREIIQASTTADQEVASGTTARFCREVLERAPPQVTAVEIVTETYDVVAYFDGATEPQRRTVHARCER